MLLNEAPSTSPAAQALGRRRPGVLGRVIAEHTDVYDINDQIAALKTAAAQIPTPQDTNGRDVVRAALADGTIADVDLMGTLGRTVHFEAEYAATHESMRYVMSTMRQEQELQLQHSTPAMCTGLDQLVKQTVNKLRTSPITKSNIATADAAVTADLGKEWTAYLEQREQYHGAYAAMASFANAGLIDATWPTTDWALTRITNAEQLWPEYVTRLASLTTERGPWPDVSNHSGRREPEEWLDWLITTPEADATVLSPDDLTERLADVRTRARALSLAKKRPATSS